MPPKVSDNLCFWPPGLFGQYTLGSRPCPVLLAEFTPSIHLEPVAISNGRTTAHKWNLFVPPSFKYSPLWSSVKPWCCFCAASSLALICQINAFIKESFLLLPIWRTDIIKLLYLTILIMGFIWWLHFCHKKDSEDFSWCTTFPTRGGM